MRKQKDFKDSVGELENISLKVCKNGKTRSEIAKSANKKGKAGERKITKVLTRISGLTFVRISNSGAQLGAKNRDRVHELSEVHIAAFLGDIFAPDELELRFIIESKNYNSLAWNMLDKGQCPAKLNHWVKEINYDTETYLMSKYTRKPLPFLGFNITGKNKRGEGLWICYNKSYYEKINITNFDPKFNINIENEYELLQNIGFGNIYFIENLEQFCINNKEKLFKLRG